MKPRLIPLLAWNEAKELLVCTDPEAFHADAGWTVLGLVPKQR